MFSQIIPQFLLSYPKSDDTMFRLKYLMFLQCLEILVKTNVLNCVPTIDGSHCDLSILYQMLKQSHSTYILIVESIIDKLVFDDLDPPNILVLILLRNYDQSDFSVNIHSTITKLLEKDNLPKLIRGHEETLKKILTSQIFDRSVCEYLDGMME